MAKLNKVLKQSFEYLKDNQDHFIVIETSNTLTGYFMLKYHEGEIAIQSVCGKIVPCIYPFDIDITWKIVKTFKTSRQYWDYANAIKLRSGD